MEACQREVSIFAKHGNVRSRIRHAQFELAAKELQAIGFDVEISEAGHAEENRKNLGGDAGAPSLTGPSRKASWFPGRYATTSQAMVAGADKSGQTQLTDFLNARAAGAAGTVVPALCDHVQVSHGRGCMFTMPTAALWRKPFINR